MYTKSFEQNRLNSIQLNNRFVLIHLDLPEIDLLFRLYSKKMIKRIWLDEVVIQGDYLRNMNICLANLYLVSLQAIRKANKLSH